MNYRHRGPRYPLPPATIKRMRQEQHDLRGLPPKKRYITDVLSGERIEIGWKSATTESGDPGYRLTYSLIVRIKGQGWRMRDAHRILMDRRNKGCRWIQDQQDAEQIISSMWETAYEVAPIPPTRTALMKMFLSGLGGQEQSQRGLWRNSELPNHGNAVKLLKEAAEFGVFEVKEQSRRGEAKSYRLLITDVTMLAEIARKICRGIAREIANQAMARRLRLVYAQVKGGVHNLPTGGDRRAYSRAINTPMRGTRTWDPWLRREVIPPEDGLPELVATASTEFLASLLRV